MISFKQGINTFEDSIDSFDENITRYYELLNEQKLEFDEIIYQIDNVKILLDEEIDATDTYIKTIDESVIKITELRETLSTNLEKLSELNPAIAEKLIKPILQSFEPVQPGIENIKLSYPTLLTLVIVFISLLFSNIVTLSELN